MEINIYDIEIPYTTSMSFVLRKYYSNIKKDFLDFRKCLVFQKEQFEISYWNIGALQEFIQYPITSHILADFYYEYIQYEYLCEKLQKYPERITYIDMFPIRSLEFFEYFPCYVTINIAHDMTRFIKDYSENSHIPFFQYLFQRELEQLPKYYNHILNLSLYSLKR